MGLQHLFRASRSKRIFEGRSARQQLVHHATKRIDIARRVDFLAGGLLWGEIGRAAVGHAVQQLLRLRRQLRQPEIDQLDRSVRGLDQIRGLDVEMHHACAVECFERARGLTEDDLDFIQWERSLLCQHIAERSARHQFHGNPGRFVVFPEVIHARNVRMLDECHGAGFLAEAGARFGILGLLGAQCAKRHCAPVLEIARLVHDRHTAGSNRPSWVDLVVIGHDDEVCRGGVGIAVGFRSCRGGHGSGPWRCVADR